MVCSFLLHVQLLFSFLLISPSQPPPSLPLSFVCRIKHLDPASQTFYFIGSSFFPLPSPTSSLAESRTHKLTRLSFPFLFRRYHHLPLPPFNMDRSSLPSVPNSNASRIPFFLPSPAKRPARVLPSSSCFQPQPPLLKIVPPKLPSAATATTNQTTSSSRDPFHRTSTLPAPPLFPTWNLSRRIGRRPDLTSRVVNCM